MKFLGDTGEYAGMVLAIACADPEMLAPIWRPRRRRDQLPPDPLLVRLLVLFSLFHVVVRESPSDQSFHQMFGWSNERS